MPVADRLKPLLTDLYRLFYPAVCAACGKAAPDGSGFMCPGCRLDIPLTDYWKTKQNPVYERFAGQLPVENASAFFRYVHGSRYRDIIHGFKYSGRWKAARHFGLWYGACLAESGLYDGIDVVVPVPLHGLKLLKRGYNQAQYLAEGIAAALGTGVSTCNLVRRRHGKSQTAVGGKERWDNVHGAFTVRDPAAIEGKHILLVDDVLTTGATLISCGETILTSVPDAKLSIAALAVARH